MTLEPFDYRGFEQTRERLLQAIRAALTTADKALLLGFKQGTPTWPENLQLQNLPAVQWKLSNVQKLKDGEPAKHISLVKKLELALSG